MKITLVAGARPNFIKISPIIRAIEKAKLLGNDIHYRLVHTGQHYDDAMSLSFFRDLNIPLPDTNLNAGSGTQAEQTAAIMIAFEKELKSNPVDLVLVVGDVTSTMACAIVAKKMNVRVAHVEAGIRSGDRTMPEEINRIVTDSITDYFFTTTEHAGENLITCGVPQERIFFVGNTMIDTLVANMDRLFKPSILKDQNIEEGNYLLLTLHRPSNVDDENILKNILNAIARAANGLPIIFPVHPRTRKILHGITLSPLFVLTDAIRYLEFMYLVKKSKAVITDSGGIQEETTFLNVPCITLRNNTERPETVTIGTNELIGSSPDKIEQAVAKLLDGKWKAGSIPSLWDGQTSERIVKNILEIYR